MSVRVVQNLNEEMCDISSELGNDNDVNYET
jgi:hypothetical protein